MVLNNSSFVLLNSRDKLAGTNTDYVIYLSNYNYARGLVTVSVESVSFFNTQYPINVNNNIIKFEEDNDSIILTATIPEGSYTVTQLMVELKTQLESVGANTYTFTYSSISGKITIDVSTGVSIEFHFDQTTSPIGDIIGFTNVLISSPISQSGAYPVNLSGVLYVDLELSRWANNNILSGRTSNSIFHRIPLDVKYGGYILYQASLANDFTYLADEQLQTIQIRLLNPDGSVFLMPNNFDLNVVLRIESVQ